MLRTDVVGSGVAWRGGVRPEGDMVRVSPLLCCCACCFTVGGVGWGAVRCPLQSVSETDKALTYVLDNANVVGYVVCNPEGINFKSHLPEGRGDHLYVSLLRTTLSSPFSECGCVCRCGCACVCVCSCGCVCMCVCGCVFVCVCICACVLQHVPCVCMCACVCICIQMHVFVSCACACVCMYVHVCEKVYVCTKNNA